MLKAGQTSTVTFKVNVMGTSSEPQVRLVVGTLPEIGAIAARANEDDVWTADLVVPEGISGGSYDMRVEVVLNNRLYVPVKKTISIDGRDNSAQVQPEVAEVGDVQANDRPKPSAHIEIPVSIGDIKEDAGATATSAGDIGVHAEKTFATPMRRVVPEPIVIKQSKAKKDPKGLDMLKSFAEKPAKKVYERIVTDMPKPNSIIPTQSISMASVNSITKPVAVKIKESIAAVKIKSKAPIKLIKEQLYYE